MCVDTLWGHHSSPAPTQSLAIKRISYSAIRLINMSLTGSATVTTPCNVTMLTWWNWPMMAASCRNWSSPLQLFHFSVSLWQHQQVHQESCPEPRCSPILTFSVHMCCLHESLCTSYQPTAHAMSGTVDCKQTGSSILRNLSCEWYS